MGHLCLERYRDQLTEQLKQHQPSTQKPLDFHGDPFLAASCLQKAMRRGDQSFAMGAALALLTMDPVRLWKRLAVIALEDFGLSDLDLTARIIAAASSKRWRFDASGDELVLSYLILALLKLPRDRRITELYVLAVALEERPETHDLLDDGVSAALKAMIEDARQIVRRCERIAVVSHRSIRSVVAGASDQALSQQLSGNHSSSRLLEVCIQARRTTQTLLPVILPLWLAASSQVAPITIERTVPEVRLIGGIPSCAIDGFTRMGREALAILSRRDPHIGRLIGNLPSASARSEALVNVLFEVESGICTNEVSDPLYEELKRLSVGVWSGLPRPVLMEAMDAMRDAIPMLNDIREELHARNLR